MENGIINKLQTTMQLRTEKAFTEKKLDSLDKLISEEINSCLHIGVNLSNKECYCLLCGKKINEKEDKLYDTIDATNYLSRSYNKFDCIQTITLGLLKQNPFATREELILSLNDLMKESKNKMDDKEIKKLIK